MDQETLETYATADACVDADNAPASPRTNRRAAAAAAFLAAIGPVGAALVSGKAAAQTAITDIDILNFALNLEYVEAQFYLRAATGQGLQTADTTSSNGPAGGVNGGSLVPFTTPLFAQIAEGISVDEQNHVRYLRSALGSAAVPQPVIDLAGGFFAAGAASGVSANFNPFGDQNSFFLGAFIFEDVGVTAYAGAANLIQNKAYLSAAASILAVEAYHGGLIRSILIQQGPTDWAAAQAIANLRANGGSVVNDQGIVYPANQFANIAPADNNGLAFRRTPQQVIGVVTLNGAGNKGGFLPNGFNGNIR